jgi:hypothetical protein
MSRWLLAAVPPGWPHARCPAVPRAEPAACAATVRLPSAARRLCRQYTWYIGCWFIHRYGCAGDFASYKDLNKAAAWVDPGGNYFLPTTSVLGVPWSWYSYPCSLAAPSICE